MRDLKTTLASANFHNTTKSSVPSTPPMFQHMIGTGCRGRHYAHMNGLRPIEDGE